MRAPTGSWAMSPQTCGPAGGSAAPSSRPPTNASSCVSSDKFVLILLQHCIQVHILNT